MFDINYSDEVLEDFLSTKEKRDELFQKFGHAICRYVDHAFLLLLNILVFLQKYHAFR